MKAWFAGRGHLCSGCRARLGVQKVNKVAVAKGMSMQARFEAFNDLNPWVYDTVVRLTRELVSNGHRKVGMRMLCEVVRWEYMRFTTDPSCEFKINNDYSPRYARLIMAQEPDLADVYELRELKQP